MEELLSFKWDNHKKGFLKLLTSIRIKDSYTDVTLACDGELYNAHKIVLSASSDYFNQIFETVLCPNPVIVLKDITGKTLEALLDYMYLGEMNVRQSELSSIIQAAECIKLKGLAVPDLLDITDDNIILDSRQKSIDSSLINDYCAMSSSKRKSLDLSPNGRKRLKSQNTIDPLSSKLSKPQEKINIVIQTKTNTNDDINFLSKEKTDDLISIQSETNYITENIFVADSDLHYDENEHNMSTEINSTIQEYHTTQASIIMNPDNETTNLNEDLSSNIVTKSVRNTRSAKQVAEIINSVSRKRCCTVCMKIFTRSSDLEHHIKTHNRDKPFGCDLCSYRANKPSQLHRHNRIHTGEKPFSCDYCGHRTTQQDHMTRHIRTHTGEKPNACVYCPYRANAKQHLRRHMRLKHYNQDI